MAGELQYNTDGDLLIIESGGNAGSLAHECCCASSTPCTDCASDNLSATVTIANGCPAACTTADDNNPYDQLQSFTNEATYCEWACRDTAEVWQLLLRYTKGTGVWSAFLTAILTPPNAADFGDFGTGGYRNLTAGDVSCAGGALTGSFILEGIDNSGTGGSDCSDCSASVTLT